MVSTLLPTPTRSNVAPAVCILYGLCEGKRIGTPFERAARAAGFRIVRNPEVADIIVGHSGGCFAVPPISRAKLVVLIGLPHWPGKSTLRALIQKIALDARTGRGRLPQLAHKTFWNVVYFGNFANNWRMWRGKNSGNCRHITARTVLIRNQKDTFCTPNFANLPFQTPPALLAVDGQHDDCWLHPERYLAIIKAYHGQILAQADRR